MFIRLTVIFIPGCLLLLPFPFASFWTLTYLPLDVLQQVLMALQKVEVLELRVVPLGLHQATLLDVHHFPKAVCEVECKLWDHCASTIIV